MVKKEASGLVEQPCLGCQDKQQKGASGTEVLAL